MTRTGDLYAVAVHVKLAVANLDHAETDVAFDPFQNRGTLSQIKCEPIEIRFFGAPLSRGGNLCDKCHSIGAGIRFVVHRGKRGYDELNIRGR